MTIFWLIFMVLELHKREDDRCNAKFALITGLQVRTKHISMRAFS